MTRPHLEGGERGGKEGVFVAVALHSAGRKRYAYVYVHACMHAYHLPRALPVGPNGVDRRLRHRTRCFSDAGLVLDQ